MRPSEDLQVIAVYREGGSTSWSPPFTTLIPSPALRLEARAIGIQNSSHERVLLVDSDQFPEPGLFRELESVSCDACIIPERSANRNLVGRLTDRQRAYSEAYAMLHPGPASPAIPRFYRRDLLQYAIERIPRPVLTVGLAHEDSILYYFTFPRVHRLGRTEGAILNSDPSFADFLRKSLQYGRYAGALAKAPDMPIEIRELIRSVNWNILSWDPSLGLNSGIFIELVRAVPYLFGTLAPGLS